MPLRSRLNEVETIPSNNSISEISENFDAFILLLGIEQSSWKFGYSYDVTISDLNNSNTQGAHEFSFAYKLPCRYKGRSYETINCPTF